MLMNHTSFFDSVLFVGITPPHIVWRYRTLMANKLFKVSVLTCYTCTLYTIRTLPRMSSPYLCSCRYLAGFVRGRLSWPGRAGPI